MKLTKITIGLLLVLTTAFAACLKEEPTKITGLDFSMLIDENPPQGISLGRVVATSNKGNLTYTLTSESPAGALLISPSTGELSVLDNSYFDFEKRQIITATAAVMTNGEVLLLNIVVALNDVFEPGGGIGNPIITTSDFSLRMPENPVLGQALGNVRASTTQGQLSYSLVNASTNAGALSINSTTGALTVADNNAFDFEERTSVVATVTVDDGTNAKTLNVVVILTDVKANSTNLGYLTKAWKTQSLNYGGINISSMVHSCRTDDSMVFNTNGTYLYDGGAQLCGGADSQTQKSGTWDLDENVRFIIFDKGTANELRVDVNLLTSGQFNLSGYDGPISFSGEAVPR